MVGDAIVYGLCCGSAGFGLGFLLASWLKLL
jgi:hypothetical protein